VSGALGAFITVAKQDTAAALRRARAERLRNRSHFLAWTARYAPDGQVVAIAREALAASAQDADPFWNVALAAAPLRALIERGHGDECERALPPVLARAEEITHSLCRMDAHARLLSAVLTAPTARAAVIPGLLRAARAASSWKVPRCLADASVMVASIAPGEAAPLLAALADGRHKRQAERLIAAGDAASIPTFFW